MKIEGTIDSVIFRNDENGYTVLSIEDSDGGNITVVGSMPVFNTGEMVAFEGEYITHPVYDVQFKMTSFEYRTPQDTESILRYLSSGAVKGIGKGLAARITDRFGDDSFRIIEEEPERLAEVKGISIRKAMEISSAFEEMASSRQVFSFLQQYGISNNLIRKIYDRYKDGIYEVIKKNPYRLIEDIDGVGFKSADRIAAQVGLKTDSEYRVRYGILYSLSEGEGEGSTCLERSDLIRRSEELLEVDAEEIEIQLQNLSIERKVILLSNAENEVMVYSAGAYRAETECAKKLIELGGSTDEDEKILQKEVEELEKEMGMKLEDMQKSAVIHAITDGVLVMTGGPGTGKTTTINVMIHYFTAQGMDITLAAPTGRAAKRMTETTGCEAKTIHRLLGVGAGGLSGRTGFEHNAENPLETDVLIVDEMSMVDIYLFRSLLNAVVYGTKLILVGDENQLPSVGPGAVLKDIIASGRFGVVTLTKIYRQSEAGDIVLNAHNIRMGKQIRLDNKSKDFFFLERHNAEEIIAGIVYLIKSKLPSYVGCRSEEIQVMSPMRKGALGVENLNARLREALNPAGKGKFELEGPNGTLRTGDRVMQMKNDYDIEWEITAKNGIVLETGKGVFNGDAGTVISASSNEILVRFEDGRQAFYKGEQLSEIELAYAITIHKSQGSEYPAVIMPLVSGPKLLMNRNLLYTGVTRAKTCVVIMGSRDTVADMINNTTEQKRYTGLCGHLMRMSDMLGSSSD